MTGGIFTHLLIAALAGALALAAFTDLRSRIIENWLNAGIALAAPLFWWASGYALWPDVPIQIALALLVFALFGGMFAMGGMGGGDVKLIGALALWLPLQPLVLMLVVMAMAGGVLTIVMATAHKIRKSNNILEIPYGVAIAIATLIVIREPIINHFG